MKKPLPALRVHMILTLFLAFVATNAQAEVDLALTNISIQDSSSRYYPGERITIRVTVENLGDENSGEYDVICYASEDSTITEDDYRLAGRLGAMSLDPGKDRSYTVWGPFSDDIPTGDYSISVIITSSYDSGSRTTEASIRGRSLGRFTDRSSGPIGTSHSGRIRAEREICHFQSCRKHRRTRFRELYR